MNIIFLVIFLFHGTCSQEKIRQLPANFQLGVSTSAYQIEGAWNLNGKGESIWDNVSHETPEFTNNENGDIAADSYHKYQEDIELLKELKADYYRFSIAWTRILPDGSTDYINEDGILYYNNLIDGLISAGIEPLVTLFHWDTPQDLEDQGGWLNEDIQKHFVNYAELCFKLFGDRVKSWITFNEPINTCLEGYETDGSPPRIKMPGVGPYNCSRNVLLAHARTYKLYNKSFRKKQKGRISISINTNWYEPNSTSIEDMNAFDRAFAFHYGWWIDPIVTGDYPSIMKKTILSNSLAEGRNSSRLPKFTPKEKKLLKGSLDFFSLNHYTTAKVFPGPNPISLNPSHSNDVHIGLAQEDWQPSTGPLKYVPWGLENLLNYIKDKYNNPEVAITECGWGDFAEMKDENRALYFKGYLGAVLDAIEDGCNVTKFTFWSLMDNFEWTRGYSVKFGLVHVNFDDPNRERSRKFSSYVFEEVAKTRKLDMDFEPVWPLP